MGKGSIFDHSCHAYDGLRFVGWSVFALATLTPPIISERLAPVATMTNLVFLFISYSFIRSVGANREFLPGTPVSLLLEAKRTNLINPWNQPENEPRVLTFSRSCTAAMYLSVTFYPSAASPI